MSLQAIRGTRDILPGEVERWQRVEEAARQVFGLYGFGEIRTPVFEDSAVFVKGTGESTDIVQKEMYRFEDLGRNDLTLRPEGTPPVIRAHVEHNLAQGRSIDRYYYSGPMFRYERPQKGRYRQFHQIGVEVLGSESPRVDAEVIEMAMRWLTRLRVESPRLILNSLGDEATRQAYMEILVAAQAERLDELCADCRRRHVGNPLRVLDCKKPGCAPVIESMPAILDHLSERSARHFERLRRQLEDWGVPYEIDQRMVRGLDYYRETVFEITSSALGAQDSLLGGGRYDGLVARMGGEDTPGVGFASGVERILLAIPEGAPPAAADVFVIAFDQDCFDAAHEVLHSLRAAGVRALTAAYDSRSKRAQSAAARRSGAQWQLVVGSDEVASGRYTARRLVDDLRVEIEAPSLGEEMARLIADPPGGRSDRDGTASEGTDA